MAASKNHDQNDDQNEEQNEEQTGQVVPAADATSGVPMVPDVDWDSVKWHTEVDESGTQIKFDQIEDQFIGLFTGTRTVTQEGEDDFTILTFRGARDGLPYQTNASWKLKEGFSDISPNTIVRITYVKNVDTGRKDPMKDFRIDVADPPVAGH